MEKDNHLESIYYISYHAVYDGATYHSYVMSNHVFYDFTFSKGIKGHKWILADILEVAFLNGFRLQAGSNNKIFGMRMALSTCITLTIIQSHAHDPSFPGLTISDRKSNIY